MTDKKRTPPREAHPWRDHVGPLWSRWRDKVGPLRVMTPTPVEGYLMVRRPFAMPFVISLSDLRARAEPVVHQRKDSA